MLNNRRKRIIEGYNRTIEGLRGREFSGDVFNL